MANAKYTVFVSAVSSENEDFIATQVLASLYPEYAVCGSNEDEIGFDNDAGFLQCISPVDYTEEQKEISAVARVALDASMKNLALTASWLLARKFLHLWGTHKYLKQIADGLSIVEIKREFVLDESTYGATIPGYSHTTGTGRLRWIFSNNKNDPFGVIEIYRHGGVAGTININFDSNGVPVGEFALEGVPVVPRHLQALLDQLGLLLPREWEEKANENAMRKLVYATKKLCCIVTNQCVVSSEKSLHTLRVALEDYIAQN